MRVALVIASLLVATAALSQPAGRTPQPVIERATKGAQCVADPVFMRRNHMDLMTHQRDDTVHAGMRSGKFSLKGCVECHASRQTRSVAASPTDFCVSCHSYAAVQIDCFECHASKPAAPGSANASGAVRLAGAAK